MAAKKQRTGDESKSMGTPVPSQSWSQLPSVLRQELSRLVPGSIAGAGRYESKLARDYRSTLCGPDRTPQVRRRKLDPSATTGVSGVGPVSPLICPHHPLIAPMHFNGPSQPPCCLPLKLESPADWEQVFKLSDLGPLGVKLWHSTIGTVYYHSSNPEWRRQVLELYYSSPALFDSISFEDNSERKYEGRTVNIFKPLVVYQRNLDNNVMTATYPSTIESRPMPIDTEWYIASDDEDKEVEDQMLAQIHSKNWGNPDPAFDVLTLVKLAKMAGVYGRDDLMRALLTEAVIRKSERDAQLEQDD